MQRGYAFDTATIALDRSFLARLGDCAQVCIEIAARTSRAEIAGRAHDPWTDIPARLRRAPGERAKLSISIPWRTTDMLTARAGSGMPRAAIVRRALEIGLAALEGKIVAIGDDGAPIDARAILVAPRRYARDVHARLARLADDLRELLLVAGTRTIGGQWRPQDAARISAMRDEISRLAGEAGLEIGAGG